MVRLEKRFDFMLVSVLLPFPQVSPCDCTVMFAGEVEGDRVPQVKGASYSLRAFLGDVPTLKNRGNKVGPREGAPRSPTSAALNVSATDLSFALCFNAALCGFSASLAFPVSPLSRSVRLSANGATALPRRVFAGF